jgi:glycosyltransferase involved in cell wall biosynthesis
MARDHDVVYLVKVASLELIKQIRIHSGARIVYDLADALWLPHHANVYPNLGEMLRAVDAITCDNQFVVEFARQYNESLFLCSPPSQVELFDAARRKHNAKPRHDDIVIGWIGSAETAYNLYNIWEELEILFEKHSGIHLRLVGVGNNRHMIPHFESVRFSILPTYRRQEMVTEVLGMDIGLFPMFDIEDSRARGILKALIYMSGEAAVIASPRGDCINLIADGTNGLLADASTEWIDKLSALIDDAQLRQELASRGLETVRTRYSMKEAFEGMRAALAL